MQKLEPIKIVFIGPSGVGKSMLIDSQLGKQINVDVHNQTASCQIIRNMDDKLFSWMTRGGVRRNFTPTVVDTPGNIDSLEAVAATLKDADIILYVITATEHEKAQSYFQDLNLAIKQAEGESEEKQKVNPRRILVINKKDRDSSAPESPMAIYRNFEEILELEGYFNTSALTNENVEKLFQTIFKSAQTLAKKKISKRLRAKKKPTPIKKTNGNSEPLVLPHLNPVEIAFVGPPGVGKSSLINRQLGTVLQASIKNKKSTKSSISDILQPERFFTAEVQGEEPRNFKPTVFDTAASKEQLEDLANRLQKTDVFVYVVSVDTTIKECETYFERLILNSQIIATDAAARMRASSKKGKAFEFCKNKPQWILVINKTDMDGISGEFNDMADVKIFMQKFDIQHLFYVSAKDNEGVTKLFQGIFECAQQAHSAKRMKDTSKAKKRKNRKKKSTYRSRRTILKSGTSDLVSSGLIRKKKVDVVSSPQEFDDVVVPPSMRDTQVDPLSVETTHDLGDSVFDEIQIAPNQGKEREPKRVNWPRIKKIAKVIAGITAALIVATPALTLGIAALALTLVSVVPAFIAGSALLTALVTGPIGLIIGAVIGLILVGIAALSLYLVYRRIRSAYDKRYEITDPANIGGEDDNTIHDASSSYRFGNDNNLDSGGTELDEGLNDAIDLQKRGLRVSVDINNPPLPPSNEPEEEVSKDTVDTNTQKPRSSSAKIRPNPADAFSHRRTKSSVSSDGELEKKVEEENHSDSSSSIDLS